MTVIQTNSFLIDPRNRENDLTIGPGLTRGDLSRKRADQLARRVISQSIGFRLEPLENITASVVCVVIPASFILYHFYDSPYCTENKQVRCFIDPTQKYMLISMMTVFIGFITLIALGLLYECMTHAIYNSRHRTPLTNDEIREIADDLKTAECNRMNLPQFIETMRHVTPRIDTEDLIENKRHLLLRINTLRNMSEENVVLFFNHLEVRNYFSRYPDVLETYRHFLPEGLANVDIPPPSSLTEEPSRPSSSTSEREKIAHSDYRDLLDDFKASSTYIAQTEFATSKEQKITADILHMRPQLITELCSRIAYKIISHFIKDDSIHDVKTLLQLRPDVETTYRNRLIYKASNWNRTNILKYFLYKFSNDQLLSSLMAYLLVEKTLQSSNQEVMNELFERLIALPEEFYPVRNILSTQKIAAQFSLFSEKILASLSSDDFDSIKQVICLIRYLMHLINHHGFQNSDISPPLTVVAILTTLSEYIHNTPRSEPLGKIENNLYFARGHLPQIWEFLQTRHEKYKIPDKNFPNFFQSIEADINAKLKSLEGRSHACSSSEPTRLLHVRL